MPSLDSTPNAPAPLKSIHRRRHAAPKVFVLVDEVQIRREDPLAFLTGGGAMGELMRSRDWRQSELGPPETWPLALKSAISTVLNSGTAMHISWGENLLQFYNDAYTPVLTDGKHPAALGNSVRKSFVEIWDFIEPLFARVLHQGEAIAMENAPLMMYRDGVLKESFFSFSYSPLRSLSGDICGVVAVCWETTEEVVIKQRERGLRLLSEQLVAATTIEEVRHAVQCHVDGNRGGLPFLLWYERDETLKTLHLVMSCGISPDAPLVQALAAQDGRSLLGHALDSRAPVALQLPLHEPLAPWLLDPPPATEIQSLAIEPLCYVNYSIPDAYLVFGVSSQRPFDDALKNFYDCICRAIERAVRRIRAVELQQREAQRQFDTVMRLTLDAAHIGYWDLDLLTGIPKRSLLHDRIFGYDEPIADWSYERFLEHVVPQERELVDRKFRAGLAAKAEWDIECRITRRDGAQRSIWIHGDVLTNPAGEAVRTQGIVIDITDRKRSEAAMRESELRFASAFEHAPIGKALVALDGRYLKVNRALCEFLGYSEAELLARTFQSITHRDDLDPGMTYVRRMLSGEISTYQMEKRYVRASGLPVPALLTASIVRDDDGNPLYLIAQIQDISERQASEQAIKRAMQRLNEAQRVGKIGDWEYLPASEHITWSPQLFEIFGRDPDLGPPLDYAENVTLFDASNRAHQHLQFQRTMESGEPQDYELVACRPDGTLVPIHVLAVPHSDDSGKVIRIHGTIQDISVRKQAEEEALRLANRLTMTLDSMSDAFFTLDREWSFTFLNRQAEQILGRRREELLGRNVWSEFPSGVGCQFESEYSRALADNVSVAFVEYFEQLDAYFSVRAHPSEHGLAVYFSDITGIRQLEDQLRQSQRLESVGQLTGGMAHDFNNLLTIIMGNAEVLSEHLDSAPELQGLAKMVAQAAQRGADLTSSLLTFARKQALLPGPVDANRMLGDMHGLLRRTLGEHIEVDVSPADGLWTALADQPQLESAVLNLCLNARDAMPTGGRLSIETANAHLDAAYAAQHPDLEPGEYVLVAVTDTGTGIPADLLGRVCEPFFTTKATGKGTGLGLSMVYGFVKQSHGHLALSSGPAPGTTIRIYLPRSARTPGVAQMPAERGQERTGQGQCILLVEDDSLVRAFARRQVETLGYRVVEAQDGPDALRCLAEHPGVDLLFTDVVMSGGMSGRQLADAVHALRPDLPVLYTSGYTEDAFVHHGRLDPGVLLLGKPYLRSELAEKLHQALSREARS